MSGLFGGGSKSPSIYIPPLPPTPPPPPLPVEQSAPKDQTVQSAQQRSGYATTLLQGGGDLTPANQNKNKKVLLG